MAQEAGDGQGQAGIALAVVQFDRRAGVQGGDDGGEFDLSGWL
ncbi:hypothetical protein [Propionivibrio sp.]